MTLMLELTPEEEARLREKAARAGESSAEFAGPQADYIALYKDMTFLDLPDPLID